MDCMDFMRDKPDKFFDLAIVDPPYGIGEDGRNNHTRSNKTKSSDYRGYSKYDSLKPDESYFKELIRVSKDQIIWGANHFGMMPASPCWIIWDKLNGETDFADCELAYTSFETAARKFVFRWAGMLQGNMKDKEVRIHPNQKPIVLYDFLYINYLPKGGKVLDTHLGSGSNRISADKCGNIDFYACEQDEQYLQSQELRFKQYKSQLKIFV